MGQYLDIRGFTDCTDKQLLFKCGFLITNDKSISTETPVFKKNWDFLEIRGYVFFINNSVSFYHVETADQSILFVIGHLYNPFTMEAEERKILSAMSNLGEEDFWRYESQLTGVYVMGRIKPDGSIVHWSDCAGMRISYYGKVGDCYYLTSHVNLVAALCNLTEDKYIKKLKCSRYFHLFGNVLPSDMSVYKELKRTVPNHWYSSSGEKRRFFPFEKVKVCRTEGEYQEVVVQSAEILKNTLALCAKKWEGKRIAISVTGGKDSGVTFASANGNYDKFLYFSYISKSEEEVDARVAHDMCEKIGLEHTIINVPENNKDIPDFDYLDNIVYMNGGFIGHIKANEIRKRAILIDNNSFDIEIKSWVNEITRAYWYKKYSKKRFPKKPNGRYLATLYKVFFENRILFNKTARVFNQYISEYMTSDDIELMGDWTTLWSWEFGFSAGEGQSLISEQLLSFDVTIPFNNRRLISLMLKPKLEDRIEDRLQKDIIKTNNSTQASLNIDVVNAAHTQKRAKIEKLYLTINSHLPF